MNTVRAQRPRPFGVPFMTKPARVRNQCFADRDVFTRVGHLLVGLGDHVARDVANIDAYVPAGLVDHPIHRRSE